MGRPSKAVVQLRKHLTTREKEQREKAEASLLTGHVMRPSKSTRADPVAYTTWKRINALLGKIEKNDALFECVLNRYCSLISKQERLVEIGSRIAAMLDDLESRRDEMGNEAYMKSMLDLVKAAQRNEQQLQSVQKMALDIEKENIMTVASQLRAVPKKPKEEADDDPAAQFFARRNNG